MKNTWLISFFMAGSLLAQEKPFTGFEEGKYLGLGYYKTSLGQKGNYASYANVYADGWELFYKRDYGLASFSVEFIFGTDGFFTANITEHLTTDGVNKQDNYYTGNGYCGSFQCHVNVPMGPDRWFEETVSFNNLAHTIDRLGGLHKMTENADPVVVVWEESMNLINEPGGLIDDDDEDEFPELRAR